MDDYIDVKINIFEHTGQRARILKSLTVNQLIEEILKEFDDIGTDSPERYTLQLKGIDRALSPSLTMVQLDIQPQDEFTLGYAQQTIRQMLDPQNYATLRDEMTNKIFDIQWYPAIIGRPSTEVNHNIMLAVNAQLLPTGMTISRKHAQITFSNGSYFLEALSENNPTYLNGKEIPFNGIREIRNGDRILLGQHKVSMVFESRSRPSSAASQSAQRPGSQPLRPVVPSSTISRPPSQPLPVQPQEEQRICALIMEKGTNPSNFGQRLEISGYPFELGRTIPILTSEGQVSRRHAEINYNPQTRQYTLQDLHSTNGVMLNGVKIEPDNPYEIVNGTKIGLGQYVVFRFEVM
ncbi:MAG: hypothetical protein BGO78_11200 [Chloroflexi bacterium 44-23]|nr:MAG: hypothetical protein BGO78_11200 [Chloroflexi bacterium 44-23]